MKYINKIIPSIFVILYTFSCTTVIDPVVTAEGFDLRSSNSTSQVLQIVNDNNIVSTISWDRNNGVATVSKYKIEIAKSGTNFADPQLLNNGDDINIVGNDRKYDLKVKELNALINQFTGFQCGIPISIDVRVKSTLGNTAENAVVQYSSNLISLNVTPYSISTPILSFATSVSNAVLGPKVGAESIYSVPIYEGYIYLTAGNYKFYKADACGSFTNSISYGNNAGSLSSTGIDIVISNTGHYLVKADLVANTYSIKEFRTFGVFGTATRVTAFANAVPMLDNNNNNIWTLTVELIKGKIFRFKSNLWTGTEITPPISNVNIGTVAIPILVPVQFPPFIPSTGTTQISILGKNAVSGQVEEVTGTNGEISVPGAFVDNSTRQKYDIVLDLSKPRNYKYTITPNNN